MEKLTLSKSDLDLHVVTFGVDTYPLVEVPEQQVRLNMFFEEAHNRWPTYFQRLTTGENDFKVSGVFRRQGVEGGPKTNFDTFVMTKRGPVFSLPVQLPEPFGVTGVSENPIEEFQGVRSLFANAVPEVKFMRVGLIRRLVLGTGNEPMTALLTDKATFANAQLSGGGAKFRYRDGFCNINVQLEIVELMKETRLPIGATVTDSAGYGLQVTLDVNNTDIRQLTDPEIETILTRATGLWPDELLSFMNG